MPTLWGGSANPVAQHEKALKWVLRYLRGTVTKGLTYRIQPASGIVTYTDASHGDATGTLTTRRKAVTGVVHQIDGNTIAWFSRRQDVTATSTQEADAIGVQRVTDFILRTEHVPLVLSDNEGAIVNVKADKISRGFKHVEMPLLLVCDLFRMGRIRVEYVPTEDQVADLLTKTVWKVIHENLVGRLMGRP